MEGFLAMVKWSRRLLVSMGVLLVAIVLTVWWLARPGPLAEAATGEGNYVVGFHDYSFTPSHMSWKVGEKVTLTFVNRSEAHPGKTHEFMLGREPRAHQSMLGTDQEDGFVDDFFTGLTVHFGNASKVEMLMPGKANVVGKEAPKYYMRMNMKMNMGSGGSGDKSGDKSGGQMNMGSGDSGDKSGDKSGGQMNMGSGSDSKGGKVMKGNGLMITLENHGTATISFTVPDRPGQWTYGCFEQSGQHFLNGMRGTVTITE